MTHIKSVTHCLMLQITDEPVVLHVVFVWQILTVHYLDLCLLNLWCVRSISYGFVISAHCFCC